MDYATRSRASSATSSSSRPPAALGSTPCSAASPRRTGIEQIMNRYGLVPDEVMAFGDSMNDYEILRMVGMPIAMENGRSAIKQIARKVIGPNIEHSVQKELRRMLEELSAR